jgi:hypothetical protein
MKTFLRVCAYSFLGFVLLVGGVYVAQGLHGAAKVSRAKEQAAAEVTEALPAAKVQAVRDRDAVRAVTSTKWGRPAYAWQELTCSLGTVDAGWIVQSYTQECRIRSVDLFPTADAARVESGVPGWECDFSSLSLDVPTDPRAAAVPWASVDRGPSSALAGENPTQVGCPDLLEPSRLGVSRMLSGVRPTSLDQSPGWTVVTVSTDVSSSDLGCSPWALLFCTSPIDEPVIGEAGQEPATPGIR